MPEVKYSSHRTQPTSGSQGNTRNVAGSGTMIRFGEPVISSRSIPPPRVKEEKVRAPDASSVVVATLIL